MGWIILDAHDVDVGEVESFCSRHGTEVALMAEYVSIMRYNAHLRDYLLCVVDSASGHLQGVCWIGGNIIPVNVPAAAVSPLVREIRKRGRRYSSIVGSADQVELLYGEIQGAFGRPRDIRENQPHMEIHSRPALTPDPLVQPTANQDADVLLPAAVAMFTEEVGYSPLTAGGGYERRVRSLISEGRCLSRIEQTRRGREVIFKADLGTVGYGVTQVQGVWINPRYRGQGLAAPAMAAVVNYAHQHVAPTVSLYVNDYNAPALATYERVGFVRTGTFSTILY